LIPHPAVDGPKKSRSGHAGRIADELGKFFVRHGWITEAEAR
jgi:hypothetical protein